MIPLLEGFSRINAKSTAGAFLAELELAPSARLPVEAAVYGFACFFFEVFFGAATAGAPSTDTRRSARLERRGAALTAALAAYVATTSGDFLNSSSLDSMLSLSESSLAFAVAFTSSMEAI